jgi:hypothetical protein
MAVSGGTILWLKALAGQAFSMDDLTGILFVFGAVIVGGLIFVQQPRNRVGQLFLGIGVLWAVSGLLLAIDRYLLAGSGEITDFISWTGWIGSTFSGVAWILAVTFLFLLFPDGQLPSRGWRFVGWFTGITIFVGLAGLAAAPGPLSQLPEVANPLGRPQLAGFVALTERTEILMVADIIACLFSVFYRYRSAGPAVRLQIRWLAYTGLLLAFIFFFQHYAQQTWGEASPVNIAASAVGGLIFSLFPAITGLAILRYRLWDLDLIVRRTLQYSLLTGVLALLYFGGVVLLEGLLEPLTGEGGSPLVTVLTTLGIAALFNPLRTRIQAFIDRRFYRRKFDAEKTLAGFATAARDEVDLERMTTALLSLVQETMQPARASLWLQRQAAGRSGTAGMRPLPETDREGAPV